MPSLPDVLPAIGGLMRLLLILALVGIVAFYLYQARHQIAAWWRSLFEREDAPEETSDAATIAELAAAPPRPFASFVNPIGRETDPRRVVVITFQAFDAWAREQGYQRRQDETPSEFVQRIGHRSRQHNDARAIFGPVESATGRLALGYDRIVFGRGAAQASEIAAAKAIWQHMTKARRPEPVTQQG